jgi:hypothetical protein
MIPFPNDFGFVAGGFIAEGFVTGGFVTGGFVTGGFVIRCALTLFQPHQ